jgi:hypothetical protein
MTKDWGTRSGEERERKERQHEKRLLNYMRVEEV